MPYLPYQTGQNDPTGTTQANQYIVTKPTKTQLQWMLGGAPERKSKVNFEGNCFLK
jgi:hypothetical protein